MWGVMRLKYIPQLEFLTVTNRMNNCGEFPKFDAGNYAPVPGAFSDTLRNFAGYFPTYLYNRVNKPDSYLSKRAEVICSGEPLRPSHLKLKISNLIF